MKRLEKSVKKVTLLAWLFIFCLPAMPAEACEPYPEYWFTETITFTVPALLENISIYATDPGVTPRAAFWLYNPNEDVLYIIPKKDSEQVDTGALSPTSAEAMAWITVNAQNSPVMLEIEQLVALDSGLQDPNPVNMSRPAPEAIQIPAAQHSELFLVYQDQVITVPFTITYAINPYNSVAECNTWYERAAQTDEARVQSATDSDAESNRTPSPQNPSTLFFVALIIAGSIIIFLLAAIKLTKK